MADDTVSLAELRALVPEPDDPACEWHRMPDDPPCGVSPAVWMADSSCRCTLYLCRLHGEMLQGRGIGSTRQHWCDDHRTSVAVAWRRVPGNG